jgi:hypothetical protein
MADSFFGVARRRSAPPQQTLGNTGAVAYSGFLDEREKERDLLGRQRYITYSDIMSNTAIVAAGARYFLNLLARAGWSVTPADDSPEAQQMAEMVEEILHDMRTPWHRVVRRTGMYRFYGFSIQEWTARRREDGSLGFLDVAPRPQWTIERWDLDEVGHLRGVVQRKPQDNREVYLPRSKVVYAVDDSVSDSPEGLGLFRSIVRSARRLKDYEVLEQSGYEGDMRGTPVVRAPLEELNQKVRSGLLTQSELNQQLQAYKDFAANHVKGRVQNGMFIDSSTYRDIGEKATPSAQYKYDVSLMEGDSYGHAEIASAIERLNREIARVLGVDSLLLGSDSKGSHALATDKTQAFFLIVDGTLNEVRETYQHDLIDRLWQLNGWNPDLKPELNTEAIQFRDVNQMVENLRGLSQAGAPVMPADEAVSEVYELMGLTPPDTSMFEQDAAVRPMQVEDEAESTADMEDDD